MQILGVVSFVVSFALLVSAASRTSPPSGALVVRAGTTNSGEYKTINAALAALPNDGSTRSIFIYGGTYNEQVYITRKGKLTIYGYTTDTADYKNNAVNIVSSIPASSAGSNDASGTLRIHTDNFSLYNVNVRNNYGKGSQAVALSAYGSKSGFYGCGFYGYQDTLYSNQGTHVYLKGYIEGATDFIFGRLGQAYFGGNVIAVKAQGWVTASGREADNSAIYVFDNNKIILASGADSSANGKTYFGRPWGAYARVIFKNTEVTAPFNKAMWSVWNTGDERTDHVYFAEYNTYGSGSTGAARPSFARVLGSSDAAKWNIGTSAGSDYASWVDAAYIV